MRYRDGAEAADNAHLDRTGTEDAMASALRIGSQGALVRRWQRFLRGQGHAVMENGRFDAATDAASRAFQKTQRLTVDGIVGNQTLGKAAMLGFELVDVSTDPDLGFPAPPPFAAVVGNAARERLWGRIEYRAAPAANNPEAIRITNGWDRRNIVEVAVPQLAGIKGAPRSGRIAFHHKGAASLQGLFADLDRAGLLDRILSFDGAWVPRFIRGSRTVLSNHSYGTAIDLNAKWNPLGAQPALAGDPGCLFELVPLANRHGFYWGGHFTRRDGMHFELARPD